jgi:hypothetical protein
VNPLATVARALQARHVRFVLIGVSGANYVLPLDPQNLVAAWAACDDAGMELWSTDEPLDRPRDLWLAQQVVERRTLTRATGPNELLVDLTLVMKGFDFDAVWNERREFVVEETTVPIARLLHIIISKHQTGRDKDRLFLATHRDALEQLLRKDEPE